MLKIDLRILIAAILSFFLLVWITQFMYNYSVPRLINASKTDRVPDDKIKDTYGKINYGTTLVLVLLSSLLFGCNCSVHTLIR